MAICTESIAKFKVNDLCSRPPVHKASNLFVEKNDIMQRWKIHAGCFQPQPYLCLLSFGLWPE